MIAVCRAETNSWAVALNPYRRRAPERFTDTQTTNRPRIEITTTISIRVNPDRLQAGGYGRRATIVGSRSYRFDVGAVPVPESPLDPFFSIASVLYRSAS